MTGTPRNGLPPGAAPRLAGFHVLTVPLRWSGGEYLPVELIGVGEGRARLIRPPECGDVALFTAAGPRVWGSGDGVVCFAVPAGFDPRYLVLGPAGRDAAVQLG